MEISKEELEQLRECKAVLKAVGEMLGAEWDEWNLRRELALEPIRTPLVSDEELATLYHLDANTVPKTPQTLWRYERAIGALYLRKMLDDLRQYAYDNKVSVSVVPAWIARRMCEWWESEMLPKPDNDVP
ncbi:MAG: hypothetical protein V3U34_00665 [candidate division NC10 bacterium]